MISSLKDVWLRSIIFLGDGVIDIEVSENVKVYTDTGVDLGFLLGGSRRLRGSRFSRLRGRHMTTEGGTMTKAGDFITSEGGTMFSEGVSITSEGGNLISVGGMKHFRTSLRIPREYYDQVVIIWV